MKFKDYEKKIRESNKEYKKKILDQNQNFDFEVSFLITEARIKGGYTQKQLAKLMGTHQPSIARIEGGENLPTLSFLKKLANAVGAILIPPKFSFEDQTQDYTVESQEHLSQDVISPFFRVATAGTTGVADRVIN